MEELSGVGPIDTDLVCASGILTEVLDMAEDMPTAVLADKVTQMSTQAHVGSSRLLQAPLLDGQVLEQPETLAVNQSLAKLCHKASQLRKFEEILEMSVLIP